MSIYKEKEVLDGYLALRKTNYAVDKQTCDNIIECIIEPENIGYFRILDIGCGLSPLLPMLIDKIYNFRKNKNLTVIDYLGIDHTKEMIEHASIIHKITKGAYQNNKQMEISINYRLMDVKELFGQKELSWYNIIIVQNFIHLLLDDDDLSDLLKYISKVLINNGVFYISTKTTINPISNTTGGLCLVPKVSGGFIIYPRRVFNKESFKKYVVTQFEEEYTYELHMYQSNDAISNNFLNLIGRKDSFKLYQKYKYSVGFDERLIGLSKIFATCNNVKEYVSDLKTMEVIRKEGLIIDLYENNNKEFLKIMSIMHSIIKTIIPDKNPIYLKDKININKIGYRFKLHQDASAGWNDKSQYNEFITIGIPLSPIVKVEQGPTRIGIRQGYNSVIIPETKDDKIIDTILYNKHLGKPLQYLNCFGIEGSYYIIDQYTIHDSNFNLTQQNRNVFFITFAMTKSKSEILSVIFAETFHKQKKSLDKKEIELLIKKGYTGDDFLIDSFGKVTVKKMDMISKL